MASPRMRELERQADRLAKKLAALGEATDEATKAEKQQLRQQQRQVEGEIRAEGRREMARAAGGAAATAVLGGLADPFMTAGELQRQAGRAVGQALGGVEILGFTLGAEAGGLLGEQGGAALQDLQRKAAQAGVDVPSPADYAGFLQRAARQRFEEQTTLGSVESLLGPLAEMGAEIDEATITQVLQNEHRRAENRANFRERATRLYDHMPGTKRNVSGRGK